MPVPPLRYLLAAAVALLVTGSLGLAGVYGTSAAAARPLALAAPAQSLAGDSGAGDLAALSRERAAALARLAVTRAKAAAAAALVYTVRPGDTLSAVSAARCGTAADWTGIYAASRARGWTAWNADQLSIGQHLYIQCYDNPSLAGRAQLPQAPSTTAGSSTSLTSAYSPAPEQRTWSGQSTNSSGSTATAYQGSGSYSFSELENLWTSAGGPSWAAAHAASIAECESGGNASAYNLSGATGLWQILGSVVPGNLDNPSVNAANAVAKFNASGSTFAQWVCQ